MKKNKIVYIKDLKKKKARKQATKELLLVLGAGALVYGAMFLYGLLAWCY